MTSAKMLTMSKEETIDEPPNRIAEWRKRRGLTQAALAKRCKPTIAQQQIHKLERGERRLTDEYMRILARALNCTSHELLPLTDLSPVAQSLRRVPIVSWVSAGKMIEAIQALHPGSEDESVYVTFATDKLFALRTRGNSMNRRAADGTVIVVNPEDRNPIDGKAYIVAIDGNVMFRVYRANPIRFEADSDDPEYGVIVPREDSEVAIIGRVIKAIADM